MLEEDRRNLWWRKYGEATGNNYAKMPAELSLDNLLEITSQPLLNYLVALSYRRSKDDSIDPKNKIVFSKDTNLNAIYKDLLKSVYDRGWEKKQHPTLKEVEYPQFVRILEEIALAAWHGNGRTKTVREIEAYCENSGLKGILKIFTEGAKAGVTNLLISFFFRQNGISNTGDRTFEFTHKSFGEYLTAIRIVRELRKINKQLKRRKDDPDDGWDEKQALTRWINILGKSAIDIYLFEFIRNEVTLQDKEEVAGWQKTLSHLIGYMLRQGMPMERQDPRPSYKEECRQSRNAEEALLIVLSACARHTKEISNIPWQSEEYSFARWLSRLKNQIEENDKIIVNQCLAWLNLEGANLYGAVLNKANLYGTILDEAYLYNANFYIANLDGASFREANLEGADLEDAYLRKASLEGANLKRANLRKTNLYGADLREADFRGADLEGANFYRADLRGADLEEANFYGACLEEANLNGANFRGANLQGANLYGACLFKINIEGANFRGANLHKTNLYGAKLD